MRYILLLLAAGFGLIVHGQTKPSAVSNAVKYQAVSPSLKYRIIKSTAKTRTSNTDATSMLNSNYRISILSTDSVLIETFKLDKPAYIPVNDATMNQALLNLMVGDSAELIMNADTLFTKSFGQPRPDFIKAGDKIRFIIKVKEIISQEELRKKATQESAELVAKDSIAMQASIVELKATKKTDAGVYYNVLKKGNGIAIKKGDKVKVLYKGTLLNGQVFDQNITSGIEVNVGAGMVIQGWDSMLMNMEQEEKVVAIIPWHLAYGERGQGPIPPISTLIFEMEIVK